MGTDGASLAPGQVVDPAVRQLPPEWTPLRALEVVGSRPYTLFFESGGAPGEASE